MATHDRDVIPVGDRHGPYRRIMIVVEHSALEMDDVVVRFADGSAFSPQTRHVFAANTRSHVIDLPGTRREHPQRRVPLRQPARWRPRPGGALGAVAPALLIPFAARQRQFSPLGPGGRGVLGPAGPVLRTGGVPPAGRNERVP